MTDKAKEVASPICSSGICGARSDLCCDRLLAAMGSENALRTLFSGAGGSILAYLLIASLVLYALWRLTQSLFDTDNHGGDAKGLAIRAGLLVSGIIYAVLATYCWALARAGGDCGSGGGDWANNLAGFVGAQWTSAILRVVLAGPEIAHIVKAVRERYARHLDATAPCGSYIRLPKPA